jgi:hypothetical protein
MRPGGDVLGASRLTQLLLDLETQAENPNLPLTAAAQAVAAACDRFLDALETVPRLAHAPA